MDDGSSPLGTIRVLDCATFIAAPHCATLFAEFGADVIKVEQPAGGDSFRRFGTPTRRGDTLAWLSEARNKRSITLDLRTPEGQDLFRRLAATADLVCENFRPGTLERWGLGYQALAAVNPKLVMLRVSGYGQDGPYRDRPGFARIAHAIGGLAYLAGMPGEIPVTPGSTSLGDYIAGLYGAFGAMVALGARERTGRGQYIDVALYEAVFRVLDELAPAYARDGTVRERMGAGAANVCPHSHYPTADGKWVAIACTNDRMFARFAAVMGRPELARPDSYGTVQQRLAARETIDRLVGAWTGGLDHDDVLARCTAGEVPCGPIHSIADIFADPHFKARGTLVSVEVEGIGAVVVPAIVPRLSATPGRIDTLGPALGSANREVYLDLLGLSESEFEGLRDKGII